MCFFAVLIVKIKKRRKKRNGSVSKKLPMTNSKINSPYKLYENSYVIEKCHKKEKVKGCFAKRLFSLLCTVCFITFAFNIFFFFYLLRSSSESRHSWEKGLQQIFFSISKKDFVKGKILNFIFSFVLLRNNIVQFLKIFPLL